jgi:hypothetical protein
MSSWGQTHGPLGNVEHPTIAGDGIYILNIGPLHILQYSALSEYH